MCNIQVVFTTGKLILYITVYIQDVEDRIVNKITFQDPTHPLFIKGSKMDITNHVYGQWEKVAPLPIH